MKTLIVGTGVAAAAYTKTKPAAFGEQRKAIGGAHLWQNTRIDAKHKMGQPKQLLTGNVLPDPQRSQAPKGGEFLRAGEFAELTDKALTESVDRVERGEVITIKRGGEALKHFAVTFKGTPGAEVFDYIILAIGPGENRLIQLSKGDQWLNPEKFEGHVLTGDDFMKPDWRPPRTMLAAGEVAIYGGSATAAWIAELAAARGLKLILWFTRQGEGADGWDAIKRFDAAFPAGSRNTKVQNDSAGIRKVLNLADVRLQSQQPFRWLSLELAAQNGPEIWYPDLLIYALGYGHSAITGVGRLLDGNLRNELIPYYDKNLAISDKQCLLAVGTADQRLMIVGSGMVSAAGVDRKKLNSKLGSYGDISATLPPAARPPEGIAMVLAGIEALNQFIPAKATGPVQTIGTKFQDRTGFEWDINFNTCNRTQLALYVAQTKDLIPFAANVAVELVMRLRTQKVFGEINREKVDQICGYCDEVGKRLKSTGRNVDWINERISRRGSEDAKKLADAEGLKRAHLHEELATFILENNLLRSTLRS